MHSRSPVQRRTPLRKAPTRSPSVVYRTLAITVRFRCPHNRSIKFKLGQYGGNQYTSICWRCFSRKVCTALVVWNRPLSHTDSVSEHCRRLPDNIPNHGQSKTSTGPRRSSGLWWHCERSWHPRFQSGFCPTHPTFHRSASMRPSLTSVLWQDPSIGTEFSACWLMAEVLLRVLIFKPDQTLVHSILSPVFTNSRTAQSEGSSAKGNSQPTLRN
jgi:hypothetical protein